MPTRYSSFPIARAILQAGRLMWTARLHASEEMSVTSPS